MKMPPPITAAKKVVEAARRWARSRAKYRQLMDSKSATAKAQQSAQKKHVEDTHKLEKAVLELEATLRTYQGAPLPKGRRKKPIPWKQVLGAISTGAGVLEKAMEGGPQFPPDNVIDVKATVVDPKGG